METGVTLIFKLNQHFDSFRWLISEGINKSFARVHWKLNSNVDNISCI